MEEEDIKTETSVEISQELMGEQAGSKGPVTPIIWNLAR
jgi:hypothetical protein